MIIDELPQDSGTLSDTDMSETGGGEYNESLKRNAVLFTLKSKEVRNISQLAMNDFIDDLSMIVQQTIDVMAFKVSG